MNYRGSTFGIAAIDPVSGEWGAAVQSKFLAVGALVPWLGASGGIVLTMARTNATFGILGLKAISGKKSASNIKDTLMQSDHDIESRQFAVIDLQGNISAFTGHNCLPYANHLIHENFVCIGNTLMGSEVLEQMATAFTKTKGDLAMRLIAALSAGQLAGGDRRGMESAALIVNGSHHQTIGEINRLVDIRVDHSKCPIDDLRKLLDRHRIFYSTNHQNKYYPLTDHMKYIMITLLSELHGRRYEMQDFNVIANTYSEGIHFSKPIFINDRISGEFVHKIVEDYYNLEYLTYSNYQP